jgi:hypothetical protein
VLLQVLLLFLLLLLLVVLWLFVSVVLAALPSVAVMRVAVTNKKKHIWRIS